MDITKYTDKNAIEKLTDVDEILESWNEFLTNFTWRPDEKEFPLYHRGQIIDENKSVKWNREEVEKCMTARAKEETRLRALYNELNKLYENTMVKALAKEYDIRTEEADIIWEKAYEDNHSFGVSSIYNKFNELADMYEKLCEARSTNE